MFFAISARRRGTKGCFSRFLLVVGVRKVVFCDFCISSADDEHLSAFFCVSSADDGHFSAFSVFRRPTMSVFLRFQHFVGRRRAFFGVFSISSPDDERFFAISAFRRPTTSVFSRFLHFVGRRRAFFSDFCISKGLDSRFLNRIHVIM